MVGRLDYLELHNFKSYGGSVVVGPFKNFTAVIGTNGSGKSNLMDAISFVLGVRTAQLRGSQLRDLVYRNPDDPADDPDGRKAYVKLVYTTEEGSSTSFTRGVGLSGSSEYKVNGTIVSMEKYNEELSAIGILTRTRNFLVFQNEVEGIASRSPKELSQMFEDISGSAELRQQYDTARTDKENAEESVMYLWRQRKNLMAEKRQYREQKDEADKYRNLQNQISSAKLEMALFKLYHLEDELQTCRSEYEEKKQSILSAEAVLAEVEKTLQEGDVEIRVLEKQKTQTQRKLKRLSTEIESLQPSHVKFESELSGLTRRIKAEENNLVRARLETEKHENKLAGLQKELQNVQADIQKVDEDTAVAEESHMSAEVLQEYKSLKQSAAVRTAALQQELNLVNRNLQDASRQKESADSQYEAASSRKSALTLDIASFKDRIDSLARLEASVEDELLRLQSEHAQASGVGGERQSVRLRLEKTVGDITTALRDAKSDLNENSNRRVFEEALHNMARLFPGVRGRLSDLCKPTQNRYREAVAVVLGKLMDAIVVDTEKTGAECINYMKEQRVGMATFIPLADVRPRPIDDSLRHLGGTARLVVDILVHDEGIAPAAHYAAGNAVICDSLDEARAIRYDGGRKLKICSLDGTLINKAGFMTGGGSQHEHRAGKWDRAEIEALKKKRAHAQKELLALGSASADRRSASERMEKIDSLKRKLSILKMDREEARANLDRASHEMLSVVKELDPLQRQVDSATSSLNEIEEKHSHLVQQMSAVENQVFGDFAVRHNFSSVQLFEQQWIQKSEDLREHKLTLETHLSRLRSQIRYEQSRNQEASVTRIEQKLADQKLRLEAVKSNLKNTTAKTSELEDRTEQLKDQLKSITDEIKQKHDKGAQSRKDLSKDTEEMSSQKKELLMKQTWLDQLKARKRRILTECKVEHVAVPYVGCRNGDSARMKQTVDREEMSDGSGNNEDQEMAEGDLDENLDREGRNVTSEVGPKTDTASLNEDSEGSIDFSLLKRTLKNKRVTGDAQEEYLQEMAEKIRSYESQRAKLNPNMRAVDHMNDVCARLDNLDKEADCAKERAKATCEEFEHLKEQRQERFSKCFNHVAETITDVYKQLTKSENYPMGGTAYLSVEQQDEPYLAGVKYNAMPPTKRFRDMEQLSGGERTVAALALLFAIHSFKPSPFFILDEVDAALDSLNVGRVSSYVRSRASDVQTVVITLKDAFFEKADALIGIYRDPRANASRLLSLDLTAYDEDIETSRS